MSEIKIMSFNFAPKGWAQCNGQTLPINQNQALFSLLGTMYGGNGQTTFALPNLQGQVPIHIGNEFSVQGEAGGILAFAMAGLACSAFLPLSISFGGKEFPHLSAVIAGELIAFYQLGYGVAAFGTGPLRDLIGLSFSTIFAAGSIVAVPLVFIALLVIRRPLAARQYPSGKT